MEIKSDTLRSALMGLDEHLLEMEKQNERLWKENHDLKKENYGLVNQSVSDSFRRDNAVISALNGGGKEMSSDTAVILEKIQGMKSLKEIKDYVIVLINSFRE
jgi:hypothetical protein